MCSRAVYLTSCRLQIDACCLICEISCLPSFYLFGNVRMQCNGAMTYAVLMMNVLNQCLQNGISFSLHSFPRSCVRRTLPSFSLLSSSSLFINGKRINYFGVSSQVCHPVLYAQEVNHKEKPVRNSSINVIRKQST